MKHRNRFIAAVLSFFIGGLGQFYLAEWRFGLIYLFSDLASAAAYEAFRARAWLIINLLVSVVSSVHAYHTAKRKTFDVKEKTGGNRKEIFIE